MRDYMDRRVTPPKRDTSTMWGPPPSGKQVLNKLGNPHRVGGGGIESIIIIIVIAVVVIIIVRELKNHDDGFVDDDRK